MLPVAQAAATAFQCEVGAISGRRSSTAWVTPPVSSGSTAAPQTAGSFVKVQSSATLASVTRPAGSSLMTRRPVAAV